ncbi:MAG: histidine phosphatase family protein [Gemmatimonadota bacterium]|nr:histidine phosphatase family protein [Gemmatimonadota bacterium]
MTEKEGKIRGSEQAWPDTLWIVRHGESAGNVARAAADAAGLHTIDIATRDVDVPLSALGERQAAALGRWFAAMPADGRPNVVLSSPYLRARQTAELVRDNGGVSPDVRDILVDERLREKEFGILDRLTSRGIGQRFPEQAEFRRLLGKFYHRPPGGESWCDVILRLRSAIDTISLHHCGDRVLIVCHQVTVLCLRYLLECMTEEQILAIDREGDVANCGITSYRFDETRGKHGGLVLDLFNEVAPLEDAGTRVTSTPDVPVATK